MKTLLSLPLFGVIAALALALGGCASLLTDPPKHLYQVTPKSAFAPGLPRVPAQVLVDLPLAPSGLDTSRIALSRSPISLDYFADAEWTDRAPRLVQTALMESFENSHSVTAIDRETIGLRADFVVKTEMRHFEAIYDSPNGAPQVWVALNARLVKMPERTIIAQQTFEQKAPAEANDIQHIVLAFNDALGGAMQQIVVWTVTNPALSARRGSLSWTRFVQEPIGGSRM
jgi:cholesterol transport system auxiliary component